MSSDSLRRMLDRIEQQRARLDTYRKHWRGEQSPAFLSRKARESLDTNLTRLSVNFPRLVVESMCERLTLDGFRRDGDEQADPALWRLWRRAGLVARSELVHVDRALYGAAFVTVWGNDHGRPVVTADNPLTMACELDPATGETIRAVRRWTTPAGAHAVEFTRDAITRYDSKDRDAVPGSSSWRAADPIPNPFDVVPVVPFIRRRSVDDHDGTSLVADVLDLTDATGKVLQDSLVTSEYFARPRRYATGLEVEEDEDGNPLDPFANDRKLVSEDPDTKFGQLDASGVDGYSDLIATLTQQVGALTGLPPHYLGLHGDQPANADSVRAAEAQLTSRAYTEQRQLDEPWSLVVELMSAVADQREPNDAATILPVWRSPELRTPAQAADAAAKLYGIGVPLRSLLVDPLGYEPAAVERIMDARRGDQLDRAGTDLARLLP